MAGSVSMTRDDSTDTMRNPNCTEYNAGPDAQGEARVVEFLQAIRCEGNEYFEKENWIGAKAKYSECIDEAVRIGGSLNSRSENFKDVMKLAYSKRAEALLQLRNFDGAFSDAEKALELDPTHLKSLSRKGRAAMEIGLYEKACKAFKAVLEQSPNDAWTIEILKLRSSCLEQSRTGNHSLKFLPGKTCQRYADYVGPVEIRRVSYASGRRGLFAKEPIKAYTLVVASNAMAAAEIKPGDGGMIFDASAGKINSSSNTGVAASLSSDLEVLVQLIQRVAASKRSLAQLYSLASTGNEEMEVPSMELFKAGSEWAPSSASTQTVDVNLIKSIMKVNAFDTTVGGCKVPFGNGMESKSESSGLWVLPSFINHSCVPNCTHIDVGNVKFVRATRDIGRDEELTIPYFDGVIAGIDDRQSRARRLLFVCRCERCSLEIELRADFWQINRQVGALVPRSKQEFADGRGQFLETAEQGSLGNSFQTMLKSLNSATPNIGMRSEGWARVSGRDSKGKYEATRQLADVADRVEALIGSLEKVAANQRSWVRASFLEAYLAKYMLATICEPDAGARVKTLTVIVKTLTLVCTSEAILPHLLLCEVKGQYGEESKTYRLTKELALGAVRSHLDEEECARIWSMMLIVPSPFDYSTFSFTQ